jgi:hypothetical protein
MERDNVKRFVNGLGENLLTTSQVIKMFKDNGLWCDQAAVSCLARQGRFNARKIAGLWVFDQESVERDILQLIETKQKNRGTTNANQQT